MNLEDDCLAEERHTFHALIRFYIHFGSSADGCSHAGCRLLLQPEIVKDITLGRIIYVYSRRINRFRTEHLAVFINHRIIIVNQIKGMLAVFTGRSFHHPVITILGTHQEFHILTGSP